MAPYADQPHGGPTLRCFDLQPSPKHSASLFSLDVPFPSLPAILYDNYSFFHAISLEFSQTFSILPSYQHNTKKGQQTL
jgi:hypothetical protein